MPVASENAQERLLKLMVGERVAEWIERAVEVAEPVGDIVAKGQRLDARITEAHDHGQDVPRREAEQERTEDNGDGAQRLTCTVLVPARPRHRRRRRSGRRLACRRRADGGATPTAAADLGPFASPPPPALSPSRRRTPAVEGPSWCRWPLRPANEATGS